MQHIEIYTIIIGQDFTLIGQGIATGFSYFKILIRKRSFLIKDIVELNRDFLGTIVVRPAYSSETDHTFGRTLLNPYKMIIREEGREIHPFLYLETTEYTFHLLGNTYKTQAFPFSSQDGVAMKCAETSIYELCDFASASSALFAKVLPSDIHDKLKARLPERILPSHGLYFLFAEGIWIFPHDICWD